MTIPTHAQALRWQEWRAKSEGKSPWDGAQVAAFEILSKNCQQHGDGLTSSAARTFPQVDLLVIAWVQYNHNALVRD